MTNEEMNTLVDKAILLDYHAPNGVTHREVVATTIRLGVEYERGRILKVVRESHEGCEPGGSCAACLVEQRVAQKR